MNTTTIQPCDVTSIEATYLDCCTSDYFQGSSAYEVLAVPMHAEMTYREAYEAAKDEFHASSGWFDQVDGVGTLAELALHAMFAGVEDTDAVADFVRYIEPVPEDEEDCSETVYLYIGLNPESDD